MATEEELRQYWDQVLDLASADAAEATIITKLESVDAVGGSQLGQISVDLRAAQDVKVLGVALLELGAFDDADASQLSAEAYFRTPTKGRIVSGENTAAIKFETDANGLFECSVVNGTLNPVFVAASDTPGGPSVQSKDIQQINF